TMYLGVELDPARYTGFTMEMPNGGYKTVSFQELKVTPPSCFSIVDIKLEVEFGKAGARAETEIDFNSKGCTDGGGIRFIQGKEAVNDILNKMYREKNRYPTVEEIFQVLDPQVTILHP